MENKYNNINEELNRMKNLVKYKSGNVLNEQGAKIPGGGPDSELNLTPSELKSRNVKKQSITTMGTGLFKNGVDIIDITSNEFKNGLNSIKNLLNQTELPINLTIVGGASKVGADKGYDNEALAKRRANNFIKAVKESLPSDKFGRIKFSTSTEIGKATVKNSPEANKEQFVKILTTLSKDVIEPEGTTTARDATSTGVKNIYDIDRKKDGDDVILPPTKDNPYMIVQIYYKEGVNKKDFKDKILKATGSPVRELIDYSLAKNLKFKY